MKNILRFAVVSLSILSFGVLASCNKDDPKTITIIASPTPHAEILNGPVKKLVEAQGYKFNVKVVDDYVTPNNSLNSDPSVFANYFQHEPYLLQFNKDHKTKVKAVFGVHYELFGIYAGGKGSKDLNNIQDGAVIAVPNDPTNEARALNLLQDNNVLTLKEGVGLKAKKTDIVDNPHNVDIKEVEAAALGKQLPSTDFAVINGNYALQNKLGDALVYESHEGAVGAEVAKTYTNVVAVKESQVDDPRVKILEDAFKDPSVEAFIKDNYKGSVAYNYLTSDQLYTE